MRRRRRADLERIRRAAALHHRLHGHLRRRRGPRGAAARARRRRAPACAPTTSAVSRWLPGSAASPDVEDCAAAGGILRLRMPQQPSRVAWACSGMASWTRCTRRARRYGAGARRAGARHVHLEHRRHRRGLHAADAGRANFPRICATRRCTRRTPPASSCNACWACTTWP